MAIKDTINLLTSKIPWLCFTKNIPKTTISSAKSQNEFIFLSNLALLALEFCSRVREEDVKKIDKT